MRDACSKKYVDSIFKNDIHFNDVKLEKMNFVQINHQPALSEHLTTKICVDIAIDEVSLVRNNHDYDFNNFNLNNIKSFTLNNQALNDNQVITKPYVHEFHQENERSRQDLELNFYDESNDLVKKAKQ